MAGEVKEEKHVNAWQVVLLFEPSFPLVCKFASGQCAVVSASASTSRVGEI